MFFEPPKDLTTPLVDTVVVLFACLCSVLFLKCYDKHTSSKDTLPPLYMGSRCRAVVANLLGLSSDVHGKNKDGLTHLHFAVLDGRESDVRRIVGLGADVNAKNNDGWTPLHIASWKGHESLVRLLVELGADVYAKTNDGLMPLHIASEKGHEPVVHLLVELGASVYARTD
jgi:ankyrin repeat protein